MDNIIRTAKARYPDGVAADANLPAGKLRYLPALTISDTALEDSVCFHHDANAEGPYGYPVLMLRATRDGEQVATIDMSEMTARKLLLNLADRLGYGITPRSAYDAPSADMAAGACGKAQGTVAGLVSVEKRLADLEDRIETHNTVLADQIATTSRQGQQLSEQIAKLDRLDTFDRALAAIAIAKGAKPL